MAAPASRQNKKILMIVLSILSALIILLAVLSAWLYSGKVTGLKAKIYASGNLPAAFVGSHPIPLYSLLSRYELLKTTPGGKEQASNPQIKDLVLNKLIRDEEIALLASKYAVSVTPAQINQLYSQMQTQLVGGDEQQFEKAIGAYGKLNKQTFQESVLRSLLLEKALTMWFNSQKTLNSAIISQAESIKTEAQNGSDFGTLAKKYSNDKAGAVFSGDSGFINIDQLDPEIQSAISGAKTSDIILAFSSDGAHIIKISDKDTAGVQGKDRVRVQQIFLQESGFEVWFESQAALYRVINFTGKLSF